MSDKLEPILTLLAEKLGTTADHLWSVLLSSRLAVGLNGVAWIAIGTCLFVYGLRLLRKGSQDKVDTDDDYRDAIEFVIGISTVVIGFIFAGINFDSAFYALFMPEYSALREILQHIH